MEQKCTVKIGDTELEGTIEVERQLLTDEQVREMQEGFRKLREQLKTPIHDMFQRAMGRWTPRGVTVDGSAVTVIEDEARLIAQPESE